MPTRTRSHKSLQFKVTLLDVAPKVWRRIQVPYDFNFYQLHHAIQDAMGWFDCHLHQFFLHDPVSGRLKGIGSYLSDYGDEDDGWDNDETHYSIKDYFGVHCKRIRYEYDFGDSWEHEVLYEKTVYSGVKGPVCLGGKNPGPPEDVGGSEGFMDFLEIMKDPAHEEHEEMDEWFRNGRSGADGRRFKPKKFNKTQVRFRRVARRRTQGEVMDIE